MKIKVYRTIALAIGLLTGAAQGAEYINEAGGDWEVPGNWDTGAVPTNNVAVTIAGSAGGQPVALNADSWTYITNNALNYSATEYRTATFLLGGTGVASLDFDIGAGNTWKATSGGTYYVGSASGSDGTLNVLSGSCVLEASIMHIAQSADSTGRINITGADASYTAGRESGGTSVSVGTGGDGALYISDGTFYTRAGVTVASSGTFEVAGSEVDEIGIGSYSSINGNWQQASNSVLKVGIDSGGITPILIDDVSFDGPDGFAPATFENGALLEPYFISGTQTGKWTVMTVDGSIADSGLTLDNGGDSDWSYNVVSNHILEVWYGLGDSGYTPDPPPEIVYTNAICIWDGEAGDNDWDNPTNWAFTANNVLPLTGTGSSGATTQIDTSNNYPVYTSEYGSRDYARLYLGYADDGRFDMLGDGYQLRFDQSGSQFCGYNGNTGILNLDGGATLKTQASLFHVGNGNGSTGLVTVVNNSRWIIGRESSGVSLNLGSNGGYGEIKLVDDARFLTRAGVSVGVGTATGLFSVQGAGGQAGIGSEGTVDGSWSQNDGGTLQALVSSNGLTTIVIDDKDDDGIGGDVSFFNGSLLDVDFIGYEGANGTWDVMTWEGLLRSGDLAFAPGVDTDIWSFAFVDTDSSNGVDTLRIEASGLITDPTVQPNITAVSASNTTISLTWDSEPIVGYNVLSTTDLVIGPWSTNIAGITGMGASTTTNLTGVGPQEFYKIEAFGQ
ncbi:hypothetical protein P4C99_07375 [Pontiellaceae bacterium B1224]|nr:hypothetical protein [Pontiellaceae bacterium B1224]